MLRPYRVTCLMAGLLLAANSFAQVPANAPAGTTGLCKDGSYSSAPSKRGACSGHKGVQTWYAAGAGAASGGAAATTAAPAPAATPAGASASGPAMAMKAKTSTSAPLANAAPGGGPGMVWVNTSSKVYHCQSDRYYGKTKNGAYMSEADAKAKGNRPDHGKACQ